MESSSPLPLTQDVLAEHLYQKVVEVLRDYFPNARESYNDVPTAAKVTGMLLERSADSVARLLGDTGRLVADVGHSLCCLEDGKEMLSQLSNEVLGDLLFERVSRYDDCLTPQITGMLLELDVRFVSQLLKDDRLLAAAVDKARAAIQSVKDAGIDQCSDTNDPSTVSAVS